jgi:hypothetical protein
MASQAEAVEGVVIPEVVGERERRLIVVRVKRSKGTVQGPGNVRKFLLDFSLGQIANEVTVWLASNSTSTLPKG